MLKNRLYLLTLITAMCLTGCDEVRTKLHMMPNQDEQECLNSEKFNFKDPEVLFVANLGDRGWKLEPNSYWVRYKAKNSYGAYLQGNMLCRNIAGKWVRDSSNEYLMALSISGSLLDKEIATMRVTPGYRSPFGTTEASASEKSYEAAMEIMTKSPETLAPYFKK